MLTVNQVVKAYGDNIILQDASFTVNRGDRLGLIGPNGCGKTTLLKIIVGQETPDNGTVTLTAPDVRIGYLEQALSYADEATVGEVLLTRVAEAENEVERLAAQMAHASDSDLEALMEAYARALDQLEAGGGYSVEAEMEAVLAGLGLDHLERDTPVRILSGGQKTRLGLARLLLEKPHLLLLDEPTNHLDIDALEWLEAFISHYDGAALVVSHDRTFLDRTVNAILELDPVEHTVRAYAGNYSAYVRTKEREYAYLWSTYKDQQERIAQYRKAITGFETYARNIEHGTINFAIRKIAKGIARKAVVQKRRLERYLESEDLVDKPQR
ncbi:MAG: ABC-F family ATP-binding cassette domain-containing protein, partial [Anaerolineae bacterium]|nr:ABC-F family ATP-binding cassette domain-containing protein [Anaerolineae bacterium]